MISLYEMMMPCYKVVKRLLAYESEFGFGVNKKGGQQFRWSP